MDSLPKLLPVWPNAAEHALADLIDFSVGAKYQPDFGGAGVDIETDESGISRCLSLKCHDSRRNRLSARYLTLPFTVPNEVTDAVEPCLQYQLDLNQRIRTFESTISKYRGIIKRKGPFCSAVQGITNVVSSKKASKRLKNMEIHQSLLDLMQAQPESFCYRECNWCFTGGCLATVPRGFPGDTILIAHPCGTDLGKLTIAEYRSVPAGLTEAVLQKKSSLVLKPTDSVQGTIFQVSLRKVQKETSCCVRSKHHCQYIHLFDTLDKDPIVLSKFVYDSILCYTMPSNHIFGELLAVTETGHILLQQCDRTEPSWQASVSHEQPSTNQWWCVDFGSHPRHVCYMDRSGLYSLDARRPGSRRHIFCSNRHEAFLNDEFFLFKPNPLNCHQIYLASSKLLSVWDERHSRQPMLTWSHCLQHAPSFLEFTVFQDSEDRSHSNLYVTLGSQRSQEVAVFHVHQDLHTVQPLSLVPPWHLSRPSDFTKHLEHQGCAIDDRVLKRVNAPLIGGSMVECMSGTFSALQLTSYGDVFHQDFVLGGGEPLSSGIWNFSAGCKLLPAQDILENVKWWTDLVTACDPENEEGPEKLPLLVSHSVQYQGVRSDDTCELAQYNKANLNNLRHTVLQAMKENKVLRSKEWKQTLREMDTGQREEDSNIDGILSTLEAVHLGTWDRTARRYLEQWTEATQSPENADEVTEGAQMSCLDNLQNWTKEEQEHQPDTWQNTSLIENLVSHVNVNHSKDTLLPSQASTVEYFDPSQPLFVSDDENDLASLTQMSSTVELTGTRQKEWKIPLKKKKVSLDGF